MFKRALFVLAVFSLITSAGAQEDVAPTPTPRRAALVVTDQVGQEFALVLDQVDMTRPGYAVVYAYDERDRLADRAPMGAVALAAGSHRNVVVPLRLATLRRYGYIGTTRPVLVRLHTDDGDGRFFYRFVGKGDVPLTEGSRTFERTVQYRQGDNGTILDQTLTNGAVTVDAVFLVKDALLVVRDGEDGGVLGSAALAAGSHRFVRIALDADALSGAGYGLEPRPMTLTSEPLGGGGASPASPDAGALQLAAMLSLPVEGLPDIPTDGTLRLELGPDGMAVVLYNVTLTQTSFIALHAVDADGNVVESPVLGRAGRRNAGTHRRIVINISKNQAPVLGDKAVLWVHLDDGDRSFRYPASDLPAEVNGVPLSFEVTLY